MSVFVHHFISEHLTAVPDRLCGYRGGLCTQKKKTMSLRSTFPLIAAVLFFFFFQKEPKAAC